MFFSFEMIVARASGSIPVDFSYGFRPRVNVGCSLVDLLCSYHAAHGATFYMYFIFIFCFPK